MLSRRHLRIKVMQELYSFFHGDFIDPVKTEKLLFHNIEKIYELYLYKLTLIHEVAALDQASATDNLQKYLPSALDLKFTNRFFDNRYVRIIENNPFVQSEVKRKKISWQGDIDVVKNLFNQLKEKNEYIVYSSAEVQTDQSDLEFVLWLLSSFMEDNEILRSHFEEKNIHWSSDQYFIDPMVIKTVKQIDLKSPADNILMPLYRDEDDDKDFVSHLFSLTIQNNSKHEAEISAKAKNWDVERIAAIDILLLKMALTEIMFIPTVPVKVSINEYLEISKLFSTPNSTTFINGILDKLMLEKQNAGEIKKTGRGLIE